VSRAARNDLLTGLGGALVGVILAGGYPVVDAATGLALGAVLGGARRWPNVTVMLACAITGAALIGGGLPGGDPVAYYLLVGAHCIAAARYADGRLGIAATIVLVVVFGAMASIRDDSGPFIVFVGAAGWAAGHALRQREELAARLAERARELEEEREAHAALSVRYERARIASELHDIVAHAISVMVVQATAGQRIADHDPALTAETFENLASAARQAESDLGRLVALLGDEDAIGDAPDLSLVGELVQHAAGSGLDVTLRLEGEREGIPAAAAEAAYRVVQEGLTNALRYAPGAAVAVLLRGDSHALEVSVENGPATRAVALSSLGTGNGLRGLRERVGACAGSVDAGPLAGGGWRLVARLPRRVPQPAAGS
jgi:signal transduction histidine kinase